MPQDHIRYDILAQDALRGVIRKVLSEIATIGHLPGDHHFFITFQTGAPGVRISPHLKSKYPEQMTIVIQHQFWDLKVSETSFEIGLSFSDVPEKLLVPFSAIRGFYDPAVNFELEFDPAAGEGEVGGTQATPALPSIAETVELLVEEKKPAAEPKTRASRQKTPAPAAEAKSENGGASVVSLDAFRKKN